MFKNVFPSRMFCIIALPSLVFPTGTDKHNQGDEILKYTAKAIKDTFYLGEPIIVKHIIINTSDSSIYLCEYSDCGTISIRTPSSSLGFRHGDSRKKPNKDNFLLIPPDGVISSSTSVSPIREPGIYFYSSSRSYKQDGSEFGLNAWTGHLSSADTFIVVKIRDDLEDTPKIEIAACIITKDTIEYTMQFAVINKQSGVAYIDSIYIEFENIIKSYETDSRYETELPSSFSKEISPTPIMSDKKDITGDTELLIDTLYAIHGRSLYGRTKAPYKVNLASKEIQTFIINFKLQGSYVYKAHIFIEWHSAKNKSERVKYRYDSFAFY